MKKFLLLSAVAAFLFACGNNSEGSKTEAKDDAASTTSTTDNGNPSYDPERGIGKFTKVDVNPQLDAAMAEAGTKVYDTKCASCHKLTDENW